MIYRITEKARRMKIFLNLLILLILSILAFSFHNEP